MRIYNTRFNPTTNGLLHVGHLYMLRINEGMAHMNGGRFIVRFDDNQRYYRLTKSASELARIRDEMREDIEWAGARVDEWSSQLELEETTRRYLREFNGGDLPMHETFQSRVNPDIHNAITMGYPYAPTLTAEKVILDAKDYITYLVRGEDLICEFSLYMYFCELWNLTPPQHVYLPRLMLAGNRELGESSEHISKTRGGHTIREYRERGWSPDDLDERLRRACLIEPAEGWTPENLQEQPLWSE